MLKINKRQFFLSIEKIVLKMTKDTKTNIENISKDLNPVLCSSCSITHGLGISANYSMR